MRYLMILLLVVSCTEAQQADMLLDDTINAVGQAPKNIGRQLLDIEESEDGQDGSNGRDALYEDQDTQDRIERLEQIVEALEEDVDYLLDVPSNKPKKGKNKRK